MSYDPPSGPPPSGPPPSGPPPGGSAETLDSHGGATRPGGRGRRTTVLATVGAVGVVAVGGATWAVWSFLSTGAQPAEALPASTLAYASIDLDPSGGQKIAALRTLSRFPAFEDAVGLDADDDVRRWIFDEVADAAGCDDLDYADDVEPWLGDRFALAAVDAGGAEPAPVYVLQVSDRGGAEEGLSSISECAGNEDWAWHVRDGWALVAETQDIVDGVADDAADASLVDDEDFRHWTDAAGDSGILAMYAAPEIGTLLAKELGDDPGAAVLEDFAGAAGTLRFDDGGIELELVADAAAVGSAPRGDRAGEVVASLPEDTVAAIGLSLGEGWFADVLDQVDELAGESVDELVAEARAELGIDLPADAETLAGEALALAIDAGFDADAFLLSGAGELESAPSLGAGVKVLGDADGIEGVLDKVRTAGAGELDGILDSDADGDAVAIGPDADYRQRLLDEDGLGGTDAFRAVVEHREDAAAVLFLDADRADWLADLAGDDQEVRDNLEPITAFGLSAWADGETSHAVLKVTTD